MNDTRRVMLLIDADNVSGDVITGRAAHARRVRRHPCGARTAMPKWPSSTRPFKRLGSHSQPVDRREQHRHRARGRRAGRGDSRAPDIAVLVSSDSDFAPLVLRLREKDAASAHRPAGKTGEETTTVYDSSRTAAPGGKGARCAGAGRAQARSARTAYRRARRRRESPPLPDDVLASRRIARVALRRRVKPAAEALRAVQLLAAAPAACCSGSTRLFALSRADPARSVPQAARGEIPGWRCALPC
jgi:hypothetical protein